MNREEIKRILKTLPPRFGGVNFYGVDEMRAVTNVITNKSPFRYHGPNCLYETDTFENEVYDIARRPQPIVTFNL